MTLPWIEQTNVREAYNVSANWYDPPNNLVIQIPLAVYHCPSADFGRNAVSKAAVFGTRTAAAWDYASVNVSSYVPGYTGTTNASRRMGVMNDREGSRIAAITDGMSNTLVVSEDANRPQLWVRGQLRTDIMAQTSNYPVGNVGLGEVTGGVWADHQKAVSIGGASADGTTTTGGGPCSINCTNDWEIYGMHPGGANGLFADGSVCLLATGMELQILAAYCSRAGCEVANQE